MTTWLTDDRGNKCSVEHFRSREAAQAALDSLKNCENCTNCSRCSRCSDCSDCSRCSRCSHCSGCSGCSRCSRCSDCSRCSHCSGCSGCSRCSDCSRCSGCSNCSNCWGCSDCSHIAWLTDRINLQADPASATRAGPPPIPTIPNIHAAIYAAASSPKSLDMSNWHRCEKTHCRAGWVVTLAGVEGKALESFYNTELAAMLIYDASAPDFKIHPARFYDDNADALADMKRLAEGGGQAADASQS